MIMCSPRKRVCGESLEMNIGEMRINRTENINFLGIVLYSRFTWKARIDHIYIKIAKGIGLLRCTMRLLYTDTLVTLYTSLVSLIKPHFTYCIIGA